MWEKLKMYAVEQVLWAEKNLKGKSGAEKKAAVVQRIDDMIQLPFFLEPFDGPVISVLVDLAVSKLNALAGHGFGAVNLDEKQEAEIAENMKLPAGLKNKGNISNGEIKHGRHD